LSNFSFTLEGSEKDELSESDESSDLLLELFRKKLGILDYLGFILERYNLLIITDLLLARSGLNQQSIILHVKKARDQQLAAPSHSHSALNTAILDHRMANKLCADASESESVSW
jgi:hypothetical protein